jgi:hypothetical protein
MVDEADIQTVEVTSTDAESRQMEMMAKLAAQKLTQHYPNHVWMVGWAPGMALIIKYMGADARYGYSVDASKAASISELEHAIVMGGGELLERLGMKRGAWDGDLPQDYAGKLEAT